MDLKQLVSLVRRWFWYLTLGLVVGLIGGYMVSRIQEPIFEVSTKVMISRQIQDENPELAGLNSLQLVQTYVQMLKTVPLLEITSDRTGIDIDPKQIFVQQIPDTQIIEIKVQDSNPQEAISIANMMVQILIEQNGDMQVGQFEALESRLTAQLEKLQVQMDAFQDEYAQAQDREFTRQLAQLDDQVSKIQSDIIVLQDEIEILQPDYNQADRILLAEKQASINQLQSVLVIYEQIRANLLILGRPMESSNNAISPQLQQLDSMINLYQKLYLTLIEELESVRLAQLQQTPSVVQVEVAVLPNEPIRPIPVMYTLIGGIAGTMILLGLAFFIEGMQSSSNASELPPYTGKPWQREVPDTSILSKPAELGEAVAEKSN